MKKLIVTFVIMVLGFCAIMTAGFLISGCETGGDTVALTIDPNFVDLTGDTSNSVSNVVITQTFTVETNGLRALSLPLAWSVSNPNLGNIASSGGYSASYVRSGMAQGDNSITVRDQYGAEGVATVRQ